jgi:hypothetical protein
MAEWLRSLTSNHLPLTAVGSNPDRDSEFFHVKKLRIQLMLVVLLQCPLVPEIMHGGAHEVFLH